ncbi:hypothetical protein [Leptotrichia sp. oral taxon 847]|uniref:hypothetical protein n=1 Tax=Leptotrichia sp. oral taxon 847 TaxID=1785996 RepID=UPI0007682921|nr:hypothetical protein [Leptotrichia sp. oral taxon 847]AMD95523.1 hypothetical protein AXF11_08000 [Leptotrichia sp. oral taxon 847]
MKKLILMILTLLSLTSCVTGGVSIGSDGKVRGNVGVSTGGLIHSGIGIDTDGEVHGGVGVGF